MKDSPQKRKELIKLQILVDHLVAAQDISTEALDAYVHP